MPRGPRPDRPGCLHHVFGRGLARRPMFENRRDVRAFLALLACQARAGRVGVVAYSILTTHYHLVLRSVTGELSAVMQRVLNLYVRYFNRTRRRDGPLPRGRFGSKPVTSWRYLLRLVRYVDLNAPQARLAHRGEEYPHGSARHHLSPRRPPWMDTRLVDSVVESPLGRDPATRYRLLFGGRLERGEQELVERQMSRRARLDDELDDLVHAAPSAVRSWFTRKSMLADGTEPGPACASPDEVVAAVARARTREPEWRIHGPGDRRRPGWTLVEVAALRLLAGMTWTEIEARGVARRVTLRARFDLHRRVLREDPGYAERMARVAREALAWGRVAASSRAAAVWRELVASSPAPEVGRRGGAAAGRRSC